MRDRRRTREDRRHRKESIPMTIPLAYAAVAARRNPPALPFGWGAVTVLLVGALFTIIGIVIILYAFFGFITGTVGAALGGGGVLSILSTFMGAIILFVIGGVLAGIGGWLIRLWWIFLLVGVVAGTAGNTARDAGAPPPSPSPGPLSSPGPAQPQVSHHLYL